MTHTPVCSSEEGLVCLVMSCGTRIPDFSFAGHADLKYQGDISRDRHGTVTVYTGLCWSDSCSDFHTGYLLTKDHSTIIMY